MSTKVPFVRSALRATFLAGAAYIAINPALAQNSTDETTVVDPSAPGSSDDAESGRGFDAIVVTARRREENLQDVPVAVTAVTTETLSRNNITDITGLQRIVPSYQGGAKFLNNSIASGAIRIRGVPSVANYFNDVPFNVSGRAPYFDIESVQVLQGPQGTLFGEASNAGAVIVAPRKPGNTFSGFIDVEVGNAARKVLSAGVDIPILDDKILLRVSGKTGFVQGYIKDVFSGNRTGADDYDIGRVVLIVRPTDNLEIETLYSYEKMRNDGTSPAVAEDFNFFPSFNRNAQAAVNGMTPAQYDAARDYILSQQLLLGPYQSQGWSTGCFATASTPFLKSKVPGPNVASVVPNNCPISQGTQTPQLLTNTIKWDISDAFTVKHIFGASGNKTEAGLFDTDQTRLIIRDTNPNPLGARVVNQSLWDFENWSSELQLGGKLVDGRLNFVAGFFNRAIANEPSVQFSQFSTSLTDVATRATTSTRTKAIFGQGDFSLTDRLTATLGARKTWDKVKSMSEVLDPNTLAVTRVIGGPGTPSGEGEFSSLSYTAGLKYTLTNETMFYLTHAKGYSAGGLQNVTGNEKFMPDNLYNFEVGAKSTFDLSDSVSVRANLAAYYGLFENVKVSTSAIVPIPGTAGTQFVTITSNAGKAKVTGLSGDLALQVHDRFQLQFAGAYMDNYYTKYDSLNPVTGQPVDLSSTPFVNTPKWKMTAAATYYLPVDEAKIGKISIGADFTATPISWANIAKPIIPNVPTDPNSGAICRLRRTAANFYGPLSADGGWAYKDCAPSNYNLNMRVDWRDPMGAEGLRASLVVTNLTNFKGYTGLGFSYDSTGYTNIYPVPPRYVYLNLRYDF